MKKTKQTDFEYEKLFDPDHYFHFYAHRLNEEQTQTEIKFLINTLSLDQGHHILDLACGWGRHANRLAQQSYKVMGIDRTSGFLARAKKEAEQLNVSVNYRHGDMRGIDFQADFDRVLCLFTAFGYFDDEDNQQVLSNISRALKPEGLLCFDIPHRDVQVQKQKPYMVTHVGQDMMIDQMQFDSLSGRRYYRRTLIRDGKRQDISFFVRLYNVQEISILLTQAGLTLKQIYANWDSSEFTSESERMILIAQKRSKL
ncbi:MAG: class I SAM-dependent methyltransferase [Prochloron sp. SP5CPC1]|nr:class I SAM-dependent methyltransferase [Candidatus Paraprochloron terpiosi SP5CPC1]